MSDIKPPAQPQRTQSAQEFLNTWMDDQIANSSGPWCNSDLVNFAEAYAQSLKQAAAPQVNAPDLARRFHTLYEALAPKFGYETRKESAKPWSQVPENNKRLMEAVCEEIIAKYVLVAEYRTSSGVTTAPAEPVADPSKEELKAECEMLREELCYHRDYWAEWNMRALTAQAQKEELKTALGRARDYVVGLSAYLATCATATIIENLETTITSLHKERDYLERLLSGDGKE